MHSKTAIAHLQFKALVIQTAIAQASTGSIEMNELRAKRSSKC